MARVASGSLPEGTSLSELFRKRQRAFLAALRDAVANTGADEYIRQMFDHQRSAAYVPDRVCEIVQRALSDQRESLVEALVQRLAAYEACLGESRCRQIEAIGRRLVENRRESDSRGLRDQLSELHPLAGLARDSAQAVRALAASMHSTFAAARAKVKSKVRETAAAYRREIAALKSQARKLSEVAEEKSAKIAELENEVRVMRGSLKAGRNQLDSSQRENAQLAAQMRVMQGAVDAQEAQIRVMQGSVVADLRRQAEDARHEVEVAGDRIADQERKIARLKAAREAAAQGETQQRGVVAQLREQVTALEIANREQGGSLAQSLAEQALARTENADLSGQLTAVRNQLHRAKEGATREQNAAKEQFRNEVAGLNSQVAKLTAQLTKRTADYESAKQQVRTLSERLRNSEASLSQQSAELLRRQQRVSALEESAGAQAAALAKLERENAEFQSEVERLVEENGNSSLQAEQLETAHSETRQELRKLNRVLDRLQRRAARMKEDIAERDQTIADLEASEARLKGDADEQAAIAASARVAIAELARELATFRQTAEDLQNRVEQIRAQCSAASVDEIPKAIASSNDALQSLRGIVESNGTSSSREVVAKVQQLVEEKRQLEGKLVAALSAGSPAAAFKQIAALKQSADLLRRLCRTLDVSEGESPIPAVTSLVQERSDFGDREKQIMSAVAADSPGEIAVRLAELVRSRQVLEAALSAIGCRRDTELVDKISRLAEENAEHANVVNGVLTKLNISSPLSIPARLSDLQTKSEQLADASRLLDVSHPDLLKPAIATLLDSNREYEAANALFPIDSTHSFRERVADLLRQREALADLIGASELIPAVASLLGDRDSCGQLFARVFGILSPSPIKISFPLSKALHERLLSLVYELKRRADAAQARVDALLNRAVLLGYAGADLAEAADFIAASLVDGERQQLSQRLHQEMIDVREMSERERGIADRERGKAKRRIADLRMAIASLQERSASREDELLREMEGERRKLTQLNEELDNRRKVQDELMQVIRGEAADTDYLRSKLSDREMRQLVKAQETKRFIDQMLVQSAEETRLLELERTTQQEALGRPV